MKLIAAVVLMIIGAGCSSTPTAPDSSAERQVSFACANGESLSVRFIEARGLAILVRNGNAIELPQQPSGSGFVYSNGPNTIRGKGDELIVEIGRMLPIQCKAR